MDAFAPPETDTDPPDRFPTKSGWCIVEAEQLCIRRSGPRGTLSEVLIGSSARRATWIPRILALVLMASGIAALREPSGLCVAAPTVVFGAWLFSKTLRGRQVSVASEIPFSQIRRIEAHPPLTGITRAHFKVWFEDDLGEERLRMILLPGVLQNGARAFEKAKRLLRERDLPVLAAGTRTPPPRRQKTPEATTPRDQELRSAK